MSVITLYHGARGELIGPPEIRVRRKIKCDFGDAFYMGTNEMQAKTHVIDESDPHVYMFTISKEELEKCTIKHFDRTNEWLYFVMYCRGLFDQVKESDMYKQLQAIERSNDFIIGPIADDGFKAAFIDFRDNKCTTEVLLHSLPENTLGLQYGAKTTRALELLKHPIEISIDVGELSEIEKNAYEQRRKGFAAYDRALQTYNRSGLLYHELLDPIMKERERNENPRR